MQSWAIAQAISDFRHPSESGAAWSRREQNLPPSIASDAGLKQWRRPMIEVLKGAMVLGFLGGFVAGMFLGIWTWATLVGVM